MSLERADGIILGGAVLVTLLAVQVIEPLPRREQRKPLCVNCASLPTVLLRSCHHFLNQQNQRSYANIWTLIKCLTGRETRYRYRRVPRDIYTQGRPNPVATDAARLRVCSKSTRSDRSSVVADLSHSMDSRS